MKTDELEIESETSTKKQTSYRYERRIPLGVERDSVKSERDLLAKGSRSMLGKAERLLYVLSQG